MDGLLAYSYVSTTCIGSWGDSVARAHTSGVSRKNFLRYLLVHGGVLLPVLSPKFHELEKSE